MKSLPPDVERLLEAERRAPDPSDAARARVRRKIEITVGIAAAGAASTAAASSAAASTAAKTAALAGKSLVAKLLIGAAVSATVVGGGVYLATQKKVPIFAAPQPVESEPPHERQRAPQPMVTVPSLPPPRRPPPHPSFILEQQLLEQARAAMAARLPGRALMLLQQHERQFPAGQLAEARESLSIQALVADGHRDLARTRADEFRRRYPHSLFQPAVDASLSR
jgi:hypothetical protein